MFRFETKLIFLLVMEQQEAHSQILQSVWEFLLILKVINKYFLDTHLQIKIVMKLINMVVDDNMKKSIKKDLDNIIEITK
jgi:hypothetical protein